MTHVDITETMLARLAGIWNQNHPYETDPQTLDKAAFGLFKATTQAPFSDQQYRYAWREMNEQQKQPLRKTAQTMINAMNDPHNL